jgi:hypothetical protein
MLPLITKVDKRRFRLSVGFGTTVEEARESAMRRLKAGGPINELFPAIPLFSYGDK